MNSIKLNMTVNSLSFLTPIAPNTYGVFVKFLNSSGLPLNNPNIPNTYSATVVTTSTTFDIYVPITDGAWSAPNVTIKAFANADSNCCFTSATISLTNTLSCHFTGNIDAIQCNGLVVMTMANYQEPLTVSIKTPGSPELFTERAGNIFWFTYTPIDASLEFTVKVTDANGCILEKAATMSCPTPTFDVDFTGGGCSGSTPLPYNVRLYNVVNGTRYKVCYSDSFAPCINDCNSSDGSIVIGGDTNIAIPAPTSIGYKVVTIRVFTNTQCMQYRDYSVTVQNFGCATCPPDGSWSADSDGAWYKTETTTPTANPSGYTTVARGNNVYASIGTRIFETDYSTNTLVTTSVVWRRTIATNGPMNRSALWTSISSVSPANDLPLGMWLGFSHCLTGLTVGKTYYVGLEADNDYRLIVDGKQLMADLTGDTHFQTWKVYPVVAKKTTMLISMEAMNQALVAAFGCEIYDNTKAQLLAATSMADLNIIFTSASKRGGYFDIGGNSGGIQYGYGCPDGYKYNPCTNLCERTKYCA